MNDRFTPKHDALYSGFNILPAVIMKEQNWRGKFRIFCEEYLEIIDGLDSIEAELDLWETFWQIGFLACR